MKYGYVRVSTKDQNIARQIDAMNTCGENLDKVYVDKSSGKDFERDAYQEMIKDLECGDEVFIKSIDRLGRNYDQIIEQWNFLTKIKEVDLIVLDFPLLDTRDKEESLTGKFISDLVLQILSYVAQIERENIKKRQLEGIKVAKEKGIKFGRPPMEKPKNFKKAFESYEKGEMTLREAAEELNVNHVTLFKWFKKEKER
ncbi:recombinase family protein [Peptococcus simiae]|uniref:recombinase family protein n=1 Tax=Peptococcus simiae TaxID=1643805 RepID=UPI00397FFFC2